ncbi:MAG: redox-regulated ATPase YchF [Calditrichaeota bacterium]|nr:redox-regulated ATPase YchF [Calditrichota bacterium]RQW07919.1 MAG: redox-regulated ATPase YchF [Calditrichota bacterium]
MEVGIIGLPFSGKTTLFSTLTRVEVQTSHVSGKMEVHRGVVRIPDSRLNNLTAILKPKKQVNATVEYIEIGGLDPKNTRQKGFDPQLLAVLKNTDALCVVIRAFEDELYPHPEGSIDIMRDINIVESEFLLTDLAIVESRLNRLESQIQKAKSESDIRERELMKKLLEALEREKPLRECTLSEEDKFKLRGFQFLSAKPLLIVVNYGEADISREEELLAPLVATYQNKANTAVTGLCARLEFEIVQLEEEERGIFLEEMNISQPALPKMIQQSYRLLGLISFFTFNEDECRAWTIPQGTNARKAAGTIHTDMERGFIRAEVVHYSDFIRLKSIAKCREQGILRLEGKDYIVKDGDMITVRFNV